MSVDSAVRSGYSFSDAWGMSYMQLQAVSDLSAKHKSMELRLDATATRVGTNADKKEWKKFIEDK